MFKRFQHYEMMYPNQSIRVPDLKAIPTNITNDLDNVCKSHFSLDTFQSTAIVGVCCLLANALSGYVSGRASLKVRNINCYLL